VGWAHGLPVPRAAQSARQVLAQEMQCEQPMLKFPIALGLTLFVMPLAFCQASSPSPVFEAASVKPGGTAPIPPPSAKGLKSTGIWISEDPGRITYLNTTLIPVLTRAYQVKRRQINGPAWLDSEKYDIVATIPKGALKEQIPAMLQNLLTDRFKMIVRVETRQEKTYALVVGKNGPRFKESKDPDARGVSFDSQGHVQFLAYSLADFAEFLTNTLDRSVIDMTGLQGHYDISAELDPRISKLGPPEATEQDAANPLPSVFTSVQELGLKLEPQDGMVQHVVIEKAEKVPVEN
jgi:uncharacterized protein (TIGR03435 family)